MSFITYFKRFDRKNAEKSFLLNFINFDGNLDTHGLKISIPMLFYSKLRCPHLSAQTKINHYCIWALPFSMP